MIDTGWLKENRRVRGIEGTRHEIGVDEKKRLSRPQARGWPLCSQDIMRDP